ncbi:MAG: ABC transporter substrate-binding protein, partial [Anaerolineae bacterium]|nr:ABC transporter substrate-binding protein [Anaerolineae bacterium]
MKKSTLFLLMSILIFALMLSACGGSEEAAPASDTETVSETAVDTTDAEPAADTSEPVALVGISMPTKSSQRWIDDGNNMVAYFT